MLRPYNQSGSVALEALLSIMIMFVAIYALWGVSVLIYNQSQLSTATQFAAQTGVNAMVTIDPYLHNPSHEVAVGRPVDWNRVRQGRGECLWINLYRRALCISQSQANFVFTENTIGLLPNQFTGQEPNISALGPDTLKFFCSRNPRAYRVSEFDQIKSIWNPGGSEFSADCVSSGSGNGVTAIKADFASPASVSTIDFLDFAMGNTRRSESQLSGASAIRLLVDSKVVSEDD